MKKNKKQNPFGGEATLRCFNQVPFFRVASNVNSPYFYNILYPHAPESKRTKAGETGFCH